MSIPASRNVEDYKKTAEKAANAFTRAHVAQTPTVNARMRFITHSTYEGSWNSNMKMMEGLGTYRYPDGSEYRGCFFLGRFHGYGRLRLAVPHKFTVKGYFEKGKLVRIEDMWFADNLHAEGEFVDAQYDCSSWTYLTPEDRRYAAEVRYGHQPVGPTAYLTSSLISRKVPHNCYDTEEGFYMPKSGWIFDRPRPYTPSIFEGCEKEKKWIIKNCRTSTSPIVTEPHGKVCRAIVSNNLEAEADLLTCSDDMQPSHFVDRKRYFYKLCTNRFAAKREQKKADNRRKHNTLRSTSPMPVVHCKHRKEEMSAAQVCMEKANALYDGDNESDEETDSRNDQQVCIGPVADSTTECDSFSDQSIVEDMNTICIMADKFKHRPTTYGLNVVQSNMLRRSKTSFFDPVRSHFEL